MPIHFQHFIGWLLYRRDRARIGWVSALNGPAAYGLALLLALLVWSAWAISAFWHWLREDDPEPPALARVIWR